MRDQNEWQGQRLTTYLVHVSHEEKKVYCGSICNSIFLIDET